MLVRKLSSDGLNLDVLYLGVCYLEPGFHILSQSFSALNYCSQSLCYNQVAHILHALDGPIKGWRVFFGDDFVLQTFVA